MKRLLGWSWRSFKRIPYLLSLPFILLRIWYRVCFIRKETWHYAAITLSIVVGLITLSLVISHLPLSLFLEGITIEAAGFAFDIILFGIVLAVIQRNQEKSQKKITENCRIRDLAQNYKDKIDDLRQWSNHESGMEARFRILANIQRLLKLHQEYPQMKILKDLDLSRLSLVGIHADLSGFDFRGIPIDQSNFTGTNLEGANFEGITAESAIFDEANLKGANFNHSTLCKCSMEGANLSDVTIIEASLHQVCFTQANLSNVRLENSTFKQIDFSRALLTQSKLKNLRMTHVTWVEAHLTLATLSSTAITDGIHHNLRLYGADLRNVWMEYARLEGAHYNSQPYYRRDASKPPYPPTQFPIGFNPEAHGMIDVSKVENETPKNAA